MRQVTHSEYQSDYDRGYQEAQNDIDQRGGYYATNKINKKYPPGKKIKLTLADHYYVDGYVDGLLAGGKTR